MAEATYTRSAETSLLKTANTLAGGQLVQLPTGEAAFLDSKDPLASGAYSENFRTSGKATVQKQTGVALLAGQEAFWDHSANALTNLPANDRDFAAGVVVDDASSLQTSAVVDLNKRPRYKIDAVHGPALSTTVGTPAAGGFSRALSIGSTVKLLLSSTTEAQKVDLLSVDGMAPGAKWILEAIIRVVSNGAGAAPDLNIGVASGTHASDADAITQAAFFHIDGAALDIRAASRDGTTTVAITDTTVDFTAGSAVANRVLLQIDGRDLTNVKLYVNGVQVLSGTTFRLDNATGPLFALAHLEKTSAADVFEVDIDALRVVTSEQ